MQILPDAKRLAKGKGRLKSILTSQTVERTTNETRRAITAVDFILSSKLRRKAEAGEIRGWKGDLEGEDVKRAKLARIYNAGALLAS